MSVINRELSGFSPHSPYLLRRPNLDDFLLFSMQKRAIGEVSVKRILRNPILSHFDSSLFDALLETQTPSSRYRQHTLSNAIAPLVREATDFREGEAVIYRPPHGSYWHREPTAVHDIDESQAPGHVIIKDGRYNEVRVDARWPSLLHHDFVKVIQKTDSNNQPNRQNLAKTDDGVSIPAIATFFFKLSFFDEHIDTDTAKLTKTTMRRYNLGTNNVVIPDK